MALAQLYPEPTKLRRKGAGPSETEGLSAAHLSMARTVYHHAKDMLRAVRLTMDAESFDASVRDNLQRGQQWANRMITLSFRRHAAQF